MKTTERLNFIPLAYKCLHRLHIVPFLVTIKNQNQQESYHQALLPSTPRGFDQACLQRAEGGGGAGGGGWGRRVGGGGEDKNNFCFSVTQSCSPPLFKTDQLHSWTLVRIVESFAEAFANAMCARFHCGSHGPPTHWWRDLSVNHVVCLQMCCSGCLRDELPSWLLSVQQVIYWTAKFRFWKRRNAVSQIAMRVFLK